MQYAAAFIEWREF